MVTVERIRDDSEKRILRCSEGNRVWYQMWINPGDMLRIELLLEGWSREASEDYSGSWRWIL